MVDDTAALALHVLICAACGIRDEHHDAQRTPEHPHKLSYRDALLTVLRNFTLLVMIPMSIMNFRIMPKSVQLVGEACQEFKLYMKEMVDTEKATAAHRPAADATNLLSALVRASEIASHDKPENGHMGRGGLAEDELYGNLFIYNLAGHESTANTIATAIMYLAAQPYWQGWLHEEITTTVQSDTLQSSDYESLFPRLVRCQAVMLEVLRLHGSTVFLPKNHRQLGLHSDHCRKGARDTERHVRRDEFAGITLRPQHLGRRRTAVSAQSLVEARRRGWEGGTPRATSRHVRRMGWWTQNLPW